MRKAPEPFDDLEIGASVTTQRTAAIGSQARELKSASERRWSAMSSL